VRLIRCGPSSSCWRTCPSCSRPTSTRPSAARFGAAVTESMAGCSTPPTTAYPSAGDARRFSSSRHAVRYAGLDITVHQSDQRRAARAPLAPGPAGAALGALRNSPARSPRGQPRPRLLRAGRRAARRQPRLPRYPPASCSSAATTRCANSETRPCNRPETISGARAVLHHTDAPRPAPRMLLPPPSPRGRPRKTERPQRLPQRDHPINHHVTDRLPGRIADRDKPGRPRAP
jgi:hypothetical protein